MSRLVAMQLQSISELRAVAAQWDDLWQRSDVTRPTLRAELIAQWLEHFAPDARFRALVVELDGQFAAALPLVDTRVGPFFEAGGLPNNEWSPSGDLLLDPNADVVAVTNLLAAELNRLSWKLLWLVGLPIDAPRWQALLAALDRAGLGTDYREMFQVGVVAIEDTWETVQARQSRNHRRNMKRQMRQLETAGDVRIRFETPTCDDQVEELLRRGFTVEDRSWKGDAGTSVLRSPGLPEFYTRQAQQLARWKELSVAFLEAGGRPISFEYAWLAKNVYHSFKVGYDEAFAAASPGQLLLHHLLQRFHSDRQVRAIDFLGPMTEGTRRFKSNSYSVGRLLIAPRRVISRALLSGYKYVWPRVKHLRRRSCKHNTEQSDSEQTAAV